MKIFLAYAPEDEALKTELEEHLSLLKKQGIIDLWHTGNLRAGDVFEDIIARQIGESQIILLLISSDFLASDIADNLEIIAALKKQQKDNSRCVIPIILRDCIWRIGDFAKLTPLPTGGKPVTVSRYWPTRDEAFKNVALGIKKVADQLSGRTDDDYPSEGLEQPFAAQASRHAMQTTSTNLTTNGLKKIGIGILAIVGGLSLAFFLWKYIAGDGGIIKKEDDRLDILLRKSLRGTWVNNNYLESTLIISKLEFIDDEVLAYSKNGGTYSYCGKRPMTLKDGRVLVDYDNLKFPLVIEPQLSADRKGILSLITIYGQVDTPNGIKITNDTLLRPELAIQGLIAKVQAAIKDSIERMGATKAVIDSIPPVLNTSAISDSMAAIVLYSTLPVETLRVSPLEKIDWNNYNIKDNKKIIPNYSHIIESAPKTQSSLETNKSLEYLKKVSRATQTPLLTKPSTTTPAKINSNIVKPHKSFISIEPIKTNK